MEFLNKILEWFRNFFSKVDIPKQVESKPNEKLIIAPKSNDDYELKYAQAVILPSKLATVKAKCDLILKNKLQYVAVEESTGVPWQVVSAIHSLESGNDFKAVLHNGERIVGTGKKTTLVPKGHGPFSIWYEAAIDALGGPGKHKDKSWTVGYSLDFLEKYNGLGYRRKGVDSPYLWSFTTEQRTTGKYVADGVWDPKAISKQIGCVAILKSLNFS